MRNDTIARTGLLICDAYAKYPKAAWLVAGDWNPRLRGVGRIREENDTLDRLKFRYVKAYSSSNTHVLARRDAMFTLNLPSSLRADVNWNSTNSLITSEGVTDLAASDHDSLSTVIPITYTSHPNTRARACPYIADSDTPVVRWNRSWLAQGCMGLKGNPNYAEQGEQARLLR